MSNDNLALRDHPFKITPDARFFYRGRVMQSVYDSLLEGVFEREGLLLVASEAGTGKTTLLLKLKEALEATDCLVVFPRGPVFSFDELISACCQAAGVGDQATSRLNRIRAFTDVLVRQVDQGRATAVLIDDAEELNDDFLADLSRLTAIEKGGRRLVQIVLAGHHELVQRLTASELAFVQQCAIGYRRLAGLDRHEVADYIAYRLARVNREGIGFSPAAVRRIAQISKGVPQVVNQLCGMCLHIADIEGSDSVSLEIVEATAPDFLTDSAAAGRAASAAEAVVQAQAAPEVQPASDDGPALELGDDAVDGDATGDLEAEPHPSPISIDWRAFRGEMKGRGLLSAGKAAEETLPPLPSFYRHDVRPAQSAPPRRALWVSLMFIVGSLLGGAGAYFIGAWPSQSPAPPVQMAAPLPDSPAPSGDQVADAPTPGPRLDDAGTAGQDPQLNMPAPATAPVAPVATAAPVSPPRLPAEAPAAPARPEPPAVTAPAPVVALVPRAESSGEPPLAPRPSAPAPVTPAAPVAAIPAAAGPILAQESEPETAPDPDLLLQRPRPKPKTLALPKPVEAAATPGVPDLQLQSLSGSQPPAAAPEQPVVRPESQPTAETNRPLAPAPGDSLVSKVALQALNRLPDETVAADTAALGGSSTGPGATAGTNGQAARAPLSLLPPDLHLIGQADSIDTVESQPLLPPQIEETAATLRPETLPTSANGVSVQRPNEGVIIQFAALRNERDAGRERERLNQRFGGLLKPLDLGIAKANVNGVAYYRVRSAPLVGRGKAYDLCAELRKSAQGCMVIHPEGFIADGADDKLAAAFDAVKTKAPDATAAPAAAGRFELLDFVVARDVQDREPVDLTGVFSAATDQAYAHAKIRNGGLPATVAFVWRYDDALISRFETEIGTSVRWRTWSSSALQPGPWKVQLVAADGQILGEQPFIVE